MGLAAVTGEGTLLGGVHVAVSQRLNIEEQ